MHELSFKLSYLALKEAFKAKMTLCLYYLGKHNFGSHSLAFLFPDIRKSLIFRSKFRRHPPPILYQRDLILLLCLVIMSVSRKCWVKVLDLS